MNIIGQTITYKALGRELEGILQNLVGLKFNQDNCSNPAMLYLKSHYSEDCIKYCVGDSIESALACYLAKRGFDNRLSRRVFDIFQEVDGWQNLRDRSENEIKEIISKLNDLR